MEGVLSQKRKDDGGMQDSQLDRQFARDSRGDVEGNQGIKGEGEKQYLPEKVRASVRALSHPRRRLVGFYSL